MTELAHSTDKKAGSGAVDELLSRLLDDAFYGKTLLAVTGDPGHEQSNLSAHFASQFAAEAECLSFSASDFHSLTRDKFLSLLVSRLGPEAAEYAGDSHLLTIADYAGSLADQERLLVLLIDEAQTLTPALLETLYELVDEADEASLSCVLFGDASLASVIERVDPEGGVEDFTWYELPNEAGVQSDSEPENHDESLGLNSELGAETDVIGGEAPENFSAEPQSQLPQDIEQRSDSRAAEDTVAQAAETAPDELADEEEQRVLDFADQESQKDPQTEAPYAAEDEEIGEPWQEPAPAAQEQVNAELSREFSSATEGVTEGVKEGAVGGEYVSGVQEPAQQAQQDLVGSPEREVESELLDSTPSNKQHDEALHEQLGEEFEENQKLNSITDEVAAQFANEITTNHGTTAEPRLSASPLYQQDEASSTISSVQEQEAHADEEDDFFDTEDEFDRDIDDWLEPDRQPQLGSASSDTLAFDFDDEIDDDEEEFADEFEGEESRSRIARSSEGGLVALLIARASSAADFVKHLFPLLIERLSAGRLYWLAAAALAMAFVAVLAFWRIPAEPAQGRIELGSPLLSSTENGVNIASPQSVSRSVESLPTQRSTQAPLQPALRQAPPPTVSPRTDSVAQQTNAQTQGRTQSAPSVLQESTAAGISRAAAVVAPTADLDVETQVSVPESRLPTEPVAAAGTSDSFADSLLAAASTSYTLQILGSSSEAAVQEFVAQNAAGLRQTLGYYSSRRAGQAWYVVSYGVFADRSAAQATLNRLPSRLSAAGPWVRQLAGVQAEIQRAR